MIPPDLEDALLRFDPRRITAFLIGGKPAPQLLQRLKRRGLCRRYRVPLRSYYRWELTWQGEQELQRVRQARGLPQYPLHPMGDDYTPPPYREWKLIDGRYT